MPVQVERNGLRTIAVGTGDASRLTLPYLPRNADVQVDDLLVSSGLGGVFPAGSRWRASSTCGATRASRSRS